MKVLVVTGASGGHIFPALSFLGTLKDKYKDIETLLILPRGTSIKQIIPNDYKISYISISTIKLSLGLKNFVAILKLLKGSLEALFLLLEFRPDIVVGFGSLACVPLVLLAWVFKIKTLIHEQNVIPGRANRLLAKFSDRIAISFDETKDYFYGPSKKIVFTGNLLHKELKRIDKNKALDFLGLSSNKFTILAMGGSAGSHRINVGFLNALSLIADKSKLQIIHLTGPKDYDLLKDNYKNLNISLKLFDFLNQMQYAYSACDLVICRAGAATITEIIFFGLPAIIVPYPFAYQHQASNANVLADYGCAIVIKDNELDGDRLGQTIEDFMNNPDKVKKMRSCCENIPQGKANDLLVNTVMSL